MSKGPLKKSEVKKVRGALLDYVGDHPGKPYGTIRAHAAPYITESAVHYHLMQLVAEHRLQRLGSMYFPADQKVEPFATAREKSQRRRHNMRPI